MDPVNGENNIKQVSINIFFFAIDCLITTFSFLFKSKNLRLNLKFAIKSEILGLFNFL